MSLLTTPIDDPRFCPGCHHLRILEELAGAIGELGLRPEEVCLVTDVGCVGLADRYFNTHTFHGLHGRSVTYAEGIKRARPDCTVIVLMGDGACGIGASHVVHAARRGAGLHVIVCNNLRRGSGAGQYRSRTPGGHAPLPLPDRLPEHPFDICQLAIANGASHVGRFSAFDPELRRHLREALRAGGFVLLECWEACNASAAAAAEPLTAEALATLAERLGMPFGLLHTGGPRWRPAPQAAAEQPEPPLGFEPVRPLELSQRAAVWLAGSDGQYVDFAASVLGGLATAGSLFAVQSTDRPIVGGDGYSVATLVLSTQPIRHLGCDDPDVVVILSSSGERRLGSLGNLSPRCLVVADKDLPLTPTRATLAQVDARSLVGELGDAWVALSLSAFGLVRRGLFTGEGLLAAAEANLTGPLRAPVLAALKRAVAQAVGPTASRAPDGASARG